MGRPTESRREPVPIVLFGTPVGSSPRLTSLLLPCEPLRVTSQLRRRVSRIVVWIVPSMPAFFTEPRFLSTVVEEGPADGAMLWLMSASRVCLL
jgi:hypothetical protein